VVGGPVRLVACAGFVAERELAQPAATGGRASIARVPEQGGQGFDITTAAGWNLALAASPRGSHPRPAAIASAPN
jgi:hypothetical protein